MVGERLRNKRLMLGFAGKFCKVAGAYKPSRIHPRRFQTFLNYFSLDPALYRPFPAGAKGFALSRTSRPFPFHSSDNGARVACMYTWSSVCACSPISLFLCAPFPYHHRRRRPSPTQPARWTNPLNDGRENSRARRMKPKTFRCTQRKRERKKCDRDREKGGRLSLFVALDANSRLQDTYVQNDRVRRTHGGETTNDGISKLDFGVVWCFGCSRWWGIRITASSPSGLGNQVRDLPMPPRRSEYYVNSGLGLIQTIWDAVVALMTSAQVKATCKIWLPQLATSDEDEEMLVEINCSHILLQDSCNYS